MASRERVKNVVLCMISVTRLGAKCLIICEDAQVVKLKLMILILALQHPLNSIAAGCEAAEELENDLME